LPDTGGPNLGLPVLGTLLLLAGAALTVGRRRRDA
ncbi:MAG: LPXTG cell wall anchor domain-containing protein, partial [Actinomycetales bacterium]